MSARTTRMWLVILAMVVSWSWGQHVLQTPNLQVLYPDEGLEPFAQHVAQRGEQALAVVSELFDYPVSDITIKLETDTDIYNGYATVYPHRVITLRPLFPLIGFSDPSTSDALYQVIVHEMTHIVQLSYIQNPEGEPERAPSPSLFQAVAAATPPAWFLEGIAVWVESNYSDGGRNNDARVRGLLQALASQGEPPSLADASLMTHRDYPGGYTRYYLGGAFVAHLIDSYGFERILRLLQHYNDRGFIRQAWRDFSWAWEQSAQQSSAEEPVAALSLQEEWERWLQGLRDDAALSVAQQEGNPTIIDAAGWFSSSPVPSPDGRQLAWVAHPSDIKLVRLDAQGNPLGEVRTIITQRNPASIRWQDNQHLIYSRSVIRQRSRYAELLRLNVDTGIEERLTYGARVQHPVPLPDGCVLFVRDVLESTAQLVRWCEGQQQVWQLPAGAHVVDMASSPAGRVAASWWQGGQLDLVSFQLVGSSLQLQPLTRDAAIDAEPWWLNEESLLFRSLRGDDRNFQVYRLEGVQVPPFHPLASGTGDDATTPATKGVRLERMSARAFGIGQPSSVGGQLFYSHITGEGMEIVQQPLSPLATVALQPLPFPEASVSVVADYPSGRYQPLASLRPYVLLPVKAWTDFNDFSLETSTLGQDTSGAHRYHITLGYDSRLRGMLAGGYAYGRYHWQIIPGVQVSPNRRTSTQVSFLAGLYPYAAYGTPLESIVSGASFGITTYQPLRLWQQRWQLESSLESQVLRYPEGNGWRWAQRGQWRLSNQQRDPWGYPVKGYQLQLDALRSPIRLAGFSHGLWLQGQAHYPLWGGTLGLQAVAGYRPTMPLPVPGYDRSGMLGLDYRYSLPLQWRFGDGLYSLERISLTPQFYGWLAMAERTTDATDTTVPFGVGASLQLSGDMVMLYRNPIAAQLTLGYGSCLGFWSRIGLKMPLE